MMKPGWAEAYLGIPWITGGRDVRKGLDCWGLLRHVYLTEFKIVLPLYGAALGHLADQDTVTKLELGSERWFLVDDPEDGDAVALGRCGSFSHVGVYVADIEPSMIHTARKELSTIIPLVRLRSMGWDMVGYYRHDTRYSHHQPV